jgi:NAD(P)-dependent dehydrogenase (short-subunit alcohol dehydrogenase family)
MNNQRVLVTAGAAGIGREIARAFAANGAKVFVCDVAKAQRIFLPTMHIQKQIIQWRTK